MKRATATRNRPYRLVMLAVAFGALAGCEEGSPMSFLKPKEEPATETPESSESESGNVIERDVEKPDVFETTEKGLWDGRPSLGGIWVAHPDAETPERVIIRNTSNGKSVNGALFRRERDIPGPSLQVSSEAAEELGMLAGAPTELYVIVLRREKVEVAPPPEPAPAPADAAAPVEAAAVETSGEITETPLDPIVGAAAAIEAAEPEVAAAPAAPAKTSSLMKPYVQIGTYGVEENANRAAEQLQAAGLTATVREGTRRDKPLWRVLAGPVQTRAERKELQKKVAELGFSDAYIVRK
ncbi:SPOR domain-containing protein [Ruegeria sp. HKCCD8929]|uniref:SPOR domain-containing protein n=1 Tax=Ruegeria sp. HKCCD8929 TaxID=2683006 RepID=UPI0014886909|nr:SPOR domain-containing protein [Ruegeria sp. HKCCD8929]